MEPIAALLATILSAMTDVTTRNMRDTLGTDLQAQTVEYNGQRVIFQHQMWKVREPSVCADETEHLPEFSACIVAAKEFFIAACQHMSDGTSQGLTYDKLKSMYCVAATSFKPTIASVSSADDPTKLEAARRNCNALVAHSMGNNDPALARKRTDACNEYDALKAHN